MKDEYQLAREAIAKKDARTTRNIGAGATVGGLALSSICIQRVVEQINRKFSTVPHANSPEYILERYIRKLDRGVVAFAIIQTGLNLVIENEKYQADAFDAFARVIEYEFFDAGFLGHDKKAHKQANKNAAKNYGDVAKRQSAVKYAAAKVGFTGEQFTTEERKHVGVWCANILCDALPDVFVWEQFEEWNWKQNRKDIFKTLTITEHGEKVMEDAIEQLALSHPVWLARRTPPQEWNGWRAKPSENAGVHKHVTLLRTSQKEHVASVKKAIADGSLNPTLKGINALQRVPFKINEWLLTVMDEVTAKGIEIKKFTIKKRRKLDPILPQAELDAMDQKQKARYWEKRSEQKSRNRQLIADAARRKADLTEAHGSVGAPFYLPMSMDWRGRVYPLPTFSQLREDNVRALFLFDRGLPIEEEGIRWLQIHTANCWAEKDDNGIGLDKKTMDERVAWVQANKIAICGAVAAPTRDPEFIGPTWTDFWIKADKPFLFLAACREMVGAWVEGKDYICHLPVTFDGSCSGLQHLSAAILADEGKFVNLKDGLPQDIYSVIAAEIKEQVLKDAAGDDEKKAGFAKMFLKYKNGNGIDRSLAKRNVMTFCYSSEAPGMGDQHIEDLMIPLRNECLDNGTDHPFGDKKTYEAAARYMGKLAYAVIKDVVKRPALVMDFLKDIAGTLASEGKPVSWVTPAGLPVMNVYNEVETKTIKLCLHNGGVKNRLDMRIGEYLPKLKADKCKRAIAPNWVHSMDAAHLLLTVGACVDAGITDMLTIHDCFGCHPSKAGEFNRIIRKTFVDMYQQHSPLSDVLNRAKAAATTKGDKLPELPADGDLDLNEVLRATYAFA